MTPAQRTQVMSTTTPDGESGKHQHKPAVKPVEVVGGALAAVTSAVIASFFGLGGTLVGVAVGSVASSIGAALYNSWLHRASGRIAVTKTLVVSTVNGRRTSPDDPASLPPQLAAGLMTTPPVEVAALATGTEPATPARAPIRWQPVAALAALTFVLGLATLTVAETLIGRPVSGGSGTTVGRLVDGPAVTTTHRPVHRTSTGAPGTTTSSETSTTTDATTPPTTTEPPTTASGARPSTSAPPTATTAGPGETSGPAGSPTENLVPETAAPSPTGG